MKNLLLLLGLMATPLFLTGCQDVLQDITVQDATAAADGNKASNYAAVNIDLLRVEVSGDTDENSGNWTSLPNVPAGMRNLLITGKINVDLILRHWDELLRVAGSLKQGYVTASLLISKLQSSQQKNALTKAIQEYGKLNETIFILKYLQSPEYQKRITVQLNKGEAMHALRRGLFIANEGQIRQRHPEDQLNQAACLNLLTNAVAVWNTVYMNAAIEQLKLEGYEVNEDDVRSLSPARSEHINMYGKYYFNVEDGLKRKELRELRKPSNDPWLS